MCKKKVFFKIFVCVLFLSTSCTFGQVDENKVNEYVERTLKVIEKAYGMHAMSADDIKDHVKESYALDKEMFATLTEEEQDMVIDTIADKTCEMVKGIQLSIENLFSSVFTFDGEDESEQEN